MDSVSIGLDIGSSAIRAAEVEVSQGRRVVRRYGQIGIPAGWVVDGEVVNVVGVAETLKRLWAEVRFSSNRVILGVSGPRVFVRQADVPAVALEDLRSSLRFNSEELVPIPLDEASFDFSVLGPAPAEDQAAASGHRVLLVAAHKDMLRSYLALMTAAGLTPVAMDSSALALIRAVPPVTSEGGLEVIVSIGAELTTVAVRDQGVPRFIRTLTVGGNKLTASLAESMHLEMATAERLKRGYVPPDAPQLAQAKRAMTADVRELAEDVRATVDFFTSQAGDKTIDRILVTGGGSRTRGLANAIAGNLPVEVYEVAPFAGLATGNLGLDDQGLANAASTATTAVGLALWPFESPLIRLSILPEEVEHARQSRRRVRLAAAGLAGFVGLLAVVGAWRVTQVRQEEARLNASRHQITTLSAQMQQLQAATAVHGQMESLGNLDSAALKGDIDWVRVLGQLAEVMPPNAHITTFTGSRTTGNAATTPGQVGTVSVTVSGIGNTDVAADWLDALKKDGDITNTVLSGISVSSGQGAQTVSFSSTSGLTTSAVSSRSEKAKP